MAMSILPKEPNIKHKYRSRPSLWCAVCSAPAHGMNFDAITCQSCKAFFRRNALKQSNLFRCLTNGSCIVDVHSRRNCAFCRLAKCLAVGMKSSLIQSAEEKNRRKQYRGKEHGASGKVARLISTKGSPSTVPLMTNADHLILERIRNAYERRIQFFTMAEFLPDLQKKMADRQTNQLAQFSSLGELINAKTITILRLMLFFKLASPEFQTLDDDDKVTLVKFNMPTLITINGSLLYDPITDTFCEDKQNDMPCPGKNLCDLYGIELYQKLMASTHRLRSLIDIDSVIIHLTILILLFSRFSSCTSLAEPILNDHDHVRYAQNFYVNLLVRMLIDKVGEQYAMYLISKLILTCLNIQTFRRDIGLMEASQTLEPCISSFMKAFVIS